MGLGLGRLVSSGPNPNKERAVRRFCVANGSLFAFSLIRFDHFIGRKYFSFMFFVYFASLQFPFLAFQIWSEQCQGQKRDQNQQLIERVDDLKKFKALLRTKNNVLAVFSKTGDNVPAVKRLLPIFADVAERMYGRATLAVVNCG